MDDDEVDPLGLLLMLLPFGDAAALVLRALLVVVVVLVVVVLVCERKTFFAGFPAICVTVSPSRLAVFPLHMEPSECLHFIVLWKKS